MGLQMRFLGALFFFLGGGGACPLKRDPDLETYLPP